MRWVWANQYYLGRKIFPDSSFPGVENISAIALAQPMYLQILSRPGYHFTQQGNAPSVIICVSIPDYQSRTSGSATSAITTYLPSIFHHSVAFSRAWGSICAVAKEPKTIALAESCPVSRRDRSTASIRWVVLISNSVYHEYGKIY